ncbi:hypothetical protein DOY81_011818 [Sarcophaga bullata]|nr:hypothetical protein DOY81_011818 [Sarcophaga bullata]
MLLHKHENDRPLGFAIRDGVSKRGTSYDTKKQPGIFISRLVPGGLAESTGLFEVNDEIVEVNGVDIAGMDLDQVTDLMVANCPYLIITLIPTNQNTLIFPSGGHPSRTRPLCSSLHHTNHTNAFDMVEHDDQDEIVDLTGLILGDNALAVAMQC